MLAISLFWLGVVLIVTAILMLFWDSFRQRKLWALISLILIIPLIAHIVLNWSSLNVRRALYISIVGLLSIAVSIVGGALSQLTFLPEHEIVEVLEENIAPPADDQPLPNQEQADAAAEAVEEGYDPLLTGSEYESLGTQEIVPEDIDKTHPKTVTARYQTISGEDRMLALNKWIRLTLTDGTVVEGKLTNVLEDAVLVESSVSGGSLGLSYNDQDISSMDVRLEANEKLIKPEIDETFSDNQPEAPDQPITVESGQPQMPQINDDAVEEVQQQVNQPTSALEAMQPEIRETELGEDQQTNSEVLEHIEELIDDSKSVESPIGQ